MDCQMSIRKSEPPWASRPVKILLRDRSEATIRTMEIGDAADLYSTEKAIIRKGEGVVQGIEDLPLTLDQYREKVRERVSKPPEAAIYAVGIRHSHACGYVQIERLAPQRLRHVGVVSVGVHPLHQHLGLGRALMNYALTWARSVQPPVIRLELGVQHENYRARGLYESLGFTRESTRHRFVRNTRGEESDDDVMVLFLDSGGE